MIPAAQSIPLDDRESERGRHAHARQPSHRAEISTSPKATPVDREDKPAQLRQGGEASPSGDFTPHLLPIARMNPRYGRLPDLCLVLASASLQLPDQRGRGSHGKKGGRATDEEINTINQTHFSVNRPPLIHHSHSYLSSSTTTTMALPFGAHVPFSAHNPSPLSFGFGLGVPQHHLPPPPNDFNAMFAQSRNPAASPSLSQSQSSRALPSAEVGGTPQRTSEKRRRQGDDQEDDAAMDRSPSPADRPVRKLGAKKLRQTPLARGHSGVGVADGKSGQQDGEDDVDVGSLLGTRVVHFLVLTNTLN